jgi:HK97 family phage prohead protease
MKDYIEQRDENAERRFTSPDIQVREAGDNNVIEGIAAVVNSDTDLGFYTERIAPGAFDDVMKDDVVALFNHDPNFPLARTTANDSGKLDLFLNKRGDLGYRFTAPNTSIGRDMIENIRTGVIAKSSFAFTIEKDEWSSTRDDGTPDVRTITKLKRLYDVAPVTYPAYNTTSVAARSWENIQKPNKEYLADKIARDKDLRQLDF